MTNFSKNYAHIIAAKKSFEKFFRISLPIEFCIINIQKMNIWYSFLMRSTFFEMATIYKPREIVKKELGRSLLKKRTKSIIMFTFQWLINWQQSSHVFYQNEERSQIPKSQNLHWSEFIFCIFFCVMIERIIENRFATLIIISIILLRI